MSRGVTIKCEELYSSTYDTYSIRKFIEWNGKGILNLSPEYQRDSVWGDREREKLIDTIFHRYPLPAIILYRHIDTRSHKQVYDVIDGKQRLETILFFARELSGASKGFEAKVMTLEDGEHEKIVVDWKGLSEESRKTFLDYEIPCVIVEGEMSQIPEVFVRLNSTGKKLSRQEIRNAKHIKSQFLKRMRGFAKNLEDDLCRMKVLSRNDIVRMKAIEFLSELVISVMNEDVMDKKKLIDKMMTKDGVELRDMPDAVKVVQRAIKIIWDILPDINSLRFHKLSDFYSLVFWFAMRQDELAVSDRDARNIAGALLREFSVRADKAYQEIKDGKLKESDEKIVAYIQSVRDGGDSKSHRKERDRILSEILDGVFEKKDSRRGYNEIQRRIIWGAAKVHKCSRCKRNLTWYDFQVDHIKPHSKGGKTVLSNAALICASCNASKGNRW